MQLNWLVPNRMMHEPRMNVCDTNLISFFVDRNELKISMVSHLKYATDEDLKQVGLSKPEIRRLRKFFEKYYPHGYLSKIKRLLQNPTKKDDITVNLRFSFSFHSSHGILILSSDCRHYTRRLRWKR